MPQTVRAARPHIPSRTLIVEEVPIPAPGPGRCWSTVETAGVCLSDVHLVDGTLTPAHLAGDIPTLGHGVTGVIVDCGRDVPHWTAGRRVALQAGECAAAGS